MSNSRKKQQDAASFTAVLASYAPTATFSYEEVARDAMEIMRAARSLQKLAIDQCNRELSEREKKRERAQEANLKVMLARYGAAVTASGDPRGHVVKVKFKNGERYNDFGGEGLWCL